MGEINDNEFRKQVQIKELSDANRSATVRTACITASANFVGSLTRSERMAIAEKKSLPVYIVELAIDFEKYCNWKGRNVTITPEVVKDEPVKSEVI